MMKKFIKDKSLVIGVILASILFPILTGVLVTKPNIFKSFTNDNDWIGFFGSYTGAIIGGLITLFVLDETIKNGDVNLEKSIDSNKKLDLCKDVANAVAQYCTVARKKRNLYFRKYEIIEKLDVIDSKLFSLDRIIADLMDDENNNKMYKELEKEKQLIQEDLDCKLLEIGATDTTTPTFLLEIKLTGIEDAEELLEQVKVLNSLISCNVISDATFENHIAKLLEETTKFINDYSSMKKSS